MVESLCCFLKILIITQHFAFSQPQWTNHFLVSVNGDKPDAVRLANKYGFRVLYGILPKSYIFTRKNETVGSHSRDWRRSISLIAREHRVIHFEQQRYNIRVLRNTSPTFNDPKWGDMWYFNMNTTEVIPDQGVLSSWSQNYTGTGIVIGIVDNGVEINHPDLLINQISAYGFNFVDGSSNPSPDAGASHGTKCAGIVAAVSNNDECILGTAYDAKFVALRMMDNIGSTSAWEAAALTHRTNQIDIYSNSWGVIDRQGFHGPDPSVQTAIENGIRQETTDLNAQCGRFTGTSATAPIAAGILALTLQANTNLTWRDMQHLIVKTSKRHNLKGGIWKTNAAGKQYHDFFGFGLLDASALITDAKQWIGLPSFRVCSSDVKTVNIKQVKHLQNHLQKRNVNSLNSAEDIITSDGCNASGSNNVNYVEHIQVFIKFSANLHRDVLISIISPANTESQLLSARPYDTGSGQQAWTFSSVHFWGEMSLGNWTIRMSIPINTNQGRLLTWQLRLYGTSIHPSLGPENETVDVIKPVTRGYVDSKSDGKNELIISITVPVVVCLIVSPFIVLIIYRKFKKKQGSISDMSPNPIKSIQS
ncbi:furin-like protease kpc-1 isoform X4 [Ostrea edulis]|uniref:furin-like protease kpc-1 isoform X4 n=1 Tax=Ostrea edulis TaxID=37623 RepID=UPI0024AEE96D|nr:furin-like protease kpc-1 isoform X4 [Ostrea edulis]XP_056002605.1 furin-like protease kpc-1 isoform X4 [Ostrea edulis]